MMLMIRNVHAVVLLNDGDDDDLMFDEVIPGPLLYRNPELPV
jgi:hypothetical protein